MKIKSLSKPELVEYTSNQLSNFFPLKSQNYKTLIGGFIDDALDRTEFCIEHIAPWEKGIFDPFQSSQYFMYLYFLSNSIWRQSHDVLLATHLFLLNKTLNGIDCFYEIELPRVFYFGHTSGIVLSKATYSDYLVVFQNCTIGRQANFYPEIGKGVIVYPNSTVIGNSVIGENSVISSGVQVINKKIPKSSIVFRGENQNLILKPNKGNELDKYFRNM